MRRSLTCVAERWALRTPFRIARGVRTQAEVVVVHVTEDGVVGRGESAPNARYGEDVASVVEQIHAVASALAAGVDRAELQQLLPAGSARCAIDAALWDLDVRLGHADDLSSMLRPLLSARTLGIAGSDAMASAAGAVREAGLVKVKVSGEDPETPLRRVRDALPDATLIVDANESWSLDQVVRLQPFLAEIGVAMLEQPLPADADAGLASFRPLVPIGADESCHTAADVAALADRYQVVNIKLEKTGGLTGAFALRDAARAHGMGVMVGCMVGTSLGLAPAMVVADGADYADLDGPWLLFEDRPGGLTFLPDGTVLPPTAGFWGTRQ